MQAWFRISSPPTSGSPAAGAAGAIGMITIGGEIDAALARLCVRAVGVGRWVLRELPGIDTVVIARITPTSAIIFPHAGPAVMSGVTGALRNAGLREADSPTALEKFPEAAGEIEARMLEALARAESPLAIDLLLDQPRRWTLGANNPALVLPEEASRVLRRLIDPPLIVALGPPNIGKSSLVNALAGRGVAIVADAPGTTRDHVGVTLDLAGLVVRYLDTPGIGPTSATGEHAALDREAQAIALRLAHDADLVLLCADAGSSFVEPEAEAACLRVGLRSDLGAPSQGAEVLLSVRNHTGLEALTGAIRDRLVPPELLADERAWKFW